MRKESGTEEKEIIEKRKIYGKTKEKKFVKTCRKKEDILGLAFCICEGTRELRELTGSVYVR